MSEEKKSEAVELATELTIAWVSNPNTRSQASEVPEFLRTMYEAVLTLTGDPQEQVDNRQQQAREPAVSVRKSLASPEHIISLIDGRPYKTLKRHLANNGLTPAEYRTRFGLKSDYPMVAPAYAERRRTLAKAIGLGSKTRKPLDGASKKAPAAKPEGSSPARRSSKRKTGPDARSSDKS